MKTGIDKQIYAEVGIPLTYEVDRAGFTEVSLPCLCQPKYDGELNFAYFDDEGAVYLFNKAKYGRWRTECKATQQLETLGRQRGWRNKYLVGELHWRNQFYGGFQLHKFDDELHYAVFDEVEPFDYPNTYTIDSATCRTMAEVEAYFNWATVECGFEGIVAKPLSGLNNPKTWVKIKQTWTADLLCISADTDKAAIRLVDDRGVELCGVKVSCANRQDLVGRIVSVKHYGLIYTGGKLTGLRHPSYLGLREDKRIKIDLT